MGLGKQVPGRPYPCLQSTPTPNTSYHAFTNKRQPQYSTRSWLQPLSKLFFSPISHVIPTLSKVSSHTFFSYVDNYQAATTLSHSLLARLLSKKPKTSRTVRQSISDHNPVLGIKSSPPLSCSGRIHQLSIIFHASTYERS